MAAPVIACSYSAPVFESPKHDLYLMPLLVKLLIIGHGVFPAMPAWNTWRAPLSRKARRNHSVSYPPIRQKFFGLGQRIEQDGSTFIIAHLTTGQVKGYRLAGSITHSMKF